MTRYANHLFLLLQKNEFQLPEIRFFMFSRVTHSMWTQNHPHPLFCPTRLYTQWESTGTLGAVLTAVLDSIHQAHDFPTKPQQLIITYGEFTLTLKYGALGHTSGLILDEYEG